LQILIAAAQAFKQFATFLTGNLHRFSEDVYLKVWIA
jgi:hypothetical protein